MDEEDFRRLIADAPRTMRETYAAVTTVRAFIEHADSMLKRAKTKAERAAAQRSMDAADVARERAGGNLDLKLCDLEVWPASETRQ